MIYVQPNYSFIFDKSNLYDIIELGDGEIIQAYDIMLKQTMELSMLDGMMAYIPVEFKRKLTEQD